MTTEFTDRSIDLARSADFVLGEVTVRPGLRRIEGPAGADTLEPRVMQVLVALGEQAGRVVSKDELIARCWGGRIVGDDAITQCMAKLRRAGLRRQAFALEAVARVGYRLVELEPRRAVPAARGVRRRRGLYGLAAFAAAAVAVAAAWALRPHPLAGLDEDSPVAVQPLRAISPDPPTQQFAAAATEEIRGRITDVGLPLAQPGDGRRRFVLDGLVFREADMLIVRARLLDSQSRSVLWTGDLSAPLAQAGRLRDQLGWRVASAVQYGREALAFPSRDLTPEALGMAIQAGENVRQSNWKTAESRERLVRLAPQYARGHAQLAIFLAAASTHSEGERAEVMMARGRAEARRALELEPRDPFNITLQQVALDGRAWMERARLINKAADLRPAGAPSQSMATFLLDTGRIREGLLMSQQGAASLAGRPVVGGTYISALHLSGAHCEALARVDGLLAIRPADSTLQHAKVMATLIDGDPDAALRLLEPDGVTRAYLSGPQALPALRAVALARKSRRPAARDAAVTALTTAAEAGHLGRADAVRLLAALDAPEPALEIAEAYAADPKTSRFFNDFEPRFLFAADLEPLRRSPRMAGVFERLGLAEFWRRSGAWPDFCQTEPLSVCELIRTGVGAKASDTIRDPGGPARKPSRPCSPAPASPGATRGQTPSP